MTIHQRYRQTERRHQIKSNHV